MKAHVEAVWEGKAPWRGWEQWGCEKKRRISEQAGRLCPHCDLWEKTGLWTRAFLPTGDNHWDRRNKNLCKEVGRNVNKPCILGNVYGNDQEVPQFLSLLSLPTPLHSAAHKCCRNHRLERWNRLCGHDGRWITVGREDHGEGWGWNAMCSLVLWEGAKMQMWSTVVTSVQSGQSHVMATCKLAWPVRHRLQGQMLAQLSVW